MTSELSVKQAADALKMLQEMGFGLEQPTPITPSVEPTPVTDQATAAIDNSAIDDITVDIVAKMFPSVARKNIEANLPVILKTFKEIKFTDKKLILVALATIRAETASFEPISEYKSKYNTSPGGRAFDLYDNRRDIGNRGAPDGELFKGRGFIQLTGRANYERYSKSLGLGIQLVDNPALANNPVIAAKILATFVKDKEKQIKNALAQDDLKRVRRLINGGSHGMVPFKQAYYVGSQFLESKS